MEQNNPMPNQSFEEKLEEGEMEFDNVLIKP